MPFAQVGGLDREFVEQHTCNDPSKAWRTLQEFQSRESGLIVDEAYEQLPQRQHHLDAMPPGADGGVELVPDSPIALSAACDGMTPRTRAAHQRL